jgi:uncharacterized protein (DUF58 family)
VTAAPERPFPLVPRRRYVGVRFGQHRSPRRGQGDEVAGTRPYRSGDRPTWIDWRASARLSAAHGADEFVVREFFADTAPRVAVAVDRRARMSLYGPPFPWLDKPSVVEQAVASIARATVAEGGDLAYVEQRPGRPLWIPPGPPARVLQSLRARPTAEPPSPRGLEACLDVLGRHASSFPPGTFVFVLSDFVEAAPPRAWLRLRALHWDVVPVVVQDPTWEQSFPDIGGVLLPLRDPGTGEVRDVVLGRGEARDRAAANETRLEGILAGFRRLGFDPIVLGSSEPGSIGAGFSRWADRRRRLRRRSA